MIHVPDRSVTAVVLGRMQDGGLPHAGCRCSRCAAAWADPARAEAAACLALVDTRAGSARASVWLVDATPDIGRQLERLGDVLGPHPSRPDRLRQPDGIFLTHAHMGHVSGLAHLGPEVMAVSDLSVYAPPGVCELLATSRMWAPLVERLDLRPIGPRDEVSLAPGLAVTAVPVPHRDEWGAGTYAYRVQGPAGSLLYLPDIDAWEPWPDAEAALRGVDVALVDATFFDAGELGGRAPVAHPLVTETLARFAGVPTRLVLTHLNHTNPVLDEDGPARAAVLAAGVEVADVGMCFGL